ncbi:hypothetical protein B0H14DRAFT_3749798 [Mycena olivaceomarginata]|nr:hypothetical protein B0H14DRAFT_3749798 [Mycena olivaceomarginata]
MRLQEKNARNVDIENYVLVVVKGVHQHPIPLPSRAPPKIRAELLELLPQFGEDIPDLTTRRLLRHPLLKSFLGKKLPNALNPTLSDRHISLANRSHIKSFIDHVRFELFPKGTAWAGALYFFNQQSLTRPFEDQYIRRMVELDPSALEVHPEDEPRTSNDTPSLRFVVCMGAEGSRRLLGCQYVQSDIGFRRVTGFYEFELGGWDRDAQTSVVFCRIFITRQTAIAHQKIFEAIEDIVFATRDAGCSGGTFTEPPWKITTENCSSGLQTNMGGKRKVSFLPRSDWTCSFP